MFAFPPQPAVADARAGRPGDATDAAEPGRPGDEIDDDDVTATDVDALFAKLRANPPTEPDPDARRRRRRRVDDVEETPFRARDAALVPLIVAAARKVKRVLADEQNDVLDTLRRREPVRDVDALVPAGRRPGGTLPRRHHRRARSPPSRPGPPSVGGRRRTSTSAPTGRCRAVREQIADASSSARCASGSSAASSTVTAVNDAITKRVRGVYREWKTQRIDEQLDDMFRLAYCQGALAVLGTGHARARGPSTPTDRRRRTARTTAWPAPWRPATRSRRVTSRRRCTPGAAACCSGPTGSVPARAARLRPPPPGEAADLGPRRAHRHRRRSSCSSSCSDGRWPASTSTSCGTTGSVGPTSSGASSAPRPRCSPCSSRRSRMLAGVNLLIADRLSPTHFPPNVHPYVERFHELFGHRLRLFRYVGAGLLAVLVALPTTSQWQSWLLFRNSQSFGVSDPQFHADVGFYVFELPFLGFVLDWLFVAMVFVLVMTVLTHVLNGGVVFASPVPSVRPATKGHIAVLLAVLAALKAADYWVTRYETTNERRGFVQGATYAVVNAQLPALMLLDARRPADRRALPGDDPALVVAAAAHRVGAVAGRPRGRRLPVPGARAVARRQPEPAVRASCPTSSRNVEATRAAMGIDFDNVDRSRGRLRPARRGRGRERPGAAAGRPAAQPGRDAVAVPDRPWRRGRSVDRRPRRRPLRARRSRRSRC